MLVSRRDANELVRHDQIAVVEDARATVADVLAVVAEDRLLVDALVGAGVDATARLGEDLEEAAGPQVAVAHRLALAGRHVPHDWRAVLAAVVVVVLETTSRLVVGLGVHGGCNLVAKLAIIRHRHTVRHPVTCNRMFRPLLRYLAEGNFNGIIPVGVSIPPEDDGTLGRYQMVERP